MITLLTDFGKESIYTARSKAWIAQHIPHTPILDIAHNVSAQDINEAAYIFELIQDQIPENSVQIVAIDFDDRYKHTEIVYFHYNNRHFLSYNSGFASILFRNNPEVPIYHIGDYNRNHLDSITDAFAPFANQILESKLTDKKELLTDKQNIKTALHPVIHSNSLHGHVIYYDAKDVCYTNITKEKFDTFIGNARFDIVLSRHERISSLSEALKPIEGGGTRCYFNHAGYLTIAIHRDSARRMYGLKKGHVILIEKR